ncbi:MAG: FAD-dependent oxidoreductase [Pseudomonadota bacterium]
MATPSSIELPSHASVVVVGGGIMGCSTLYHLAKLGVTDAVLVERNELTSGTTWHSAAQVRALRHSQNLTRMIQYSVDLYAQLEAETGQSVGWIQKGSLSLATTPDRLTHIRRQASLAQLFGVRAQAISTADALERWPLMRADDVLGAVWSPDDGRVSPSDVCAALVKAAKALGARVFEHTAVTGVHTTSGRIRGLETDRGTLRCDAVALCAGLWSRELARMADSHAPLLACEHFYLLTKPVDGITGNMPTLSDHDNHLYIRDDSGGLLVGCFEPHARALDPTRLSGEVGFELLQEDWEHFEPMMVNALNRLPPLEHAEVKLLLNGPESFTPDGSFMLGETAETRGLFLGCGMNSVGIASGGGAGMHLAHCIVNGHTAYDLADTDARRFDPTFDSLEHLMARAPEVLGTHYDIAYPGTQFRTARGIQTLPAHDHHRADRAHFGQTGHWERPLFFGKQAEPRLRFTRPDWFARVAREVDAAHTRAAVFDASCFGKIDISGTDAAQVVARLCSGAVTRPPGSLSYNLMLNAGGTIELDLTVHRLTTDHYRLLVGTQVTRKAVALARDAAVGRDVQVRDVTHEHALFSLSGPQAIALARQLGATTVPGLGYFKFAPDTLAGRPVTLARLSYVGEAGVEISCAEADAVAVYSALRDAGAAPAGLFAQTAMRIEKGFCAVGHELDSDTIPAEVGLGFACRASGGYLGAEAVAAAGTVATRLRTLVFDNDHAVPIGHEPVVHGDRIIGQTTSAGFGHRINAPIALALMRADSGDPDRVDVDIAGERFPARVLTHAAFDPDGHRLREYNTP